MHAAHERQLLARARSGASGGRRRRRRARLRSVGRCALPPHEARRDAVQRAASRGWGPWLHDNMLAVVQLPAAATVTTKLCQVSTGRCIDGAAPDGQQHLPGVAPSVRVGHHAVDRSYVQFFVGPVPGVPANISIEYSVTDSPGAGNGSGSAVAGDRAQILLLATLQRGGEERLAVDSRVIRTPLSIFCVENH